MTLFPRVSVLALALALVVAWTPSGNALPPGVQDALAWYDTLGYPDARELPYVRVATGLYSIAGNQPPQNSYVEGFLVHDAPEAFTVFICSVAAFKNPFPDYEPYPPLTTVRFVRKTNVPAHQRVDFEALDFKTAATEALERLRSLAPKRAHELTWGEPVTHRARIFALGRACQQKGLAETASALIEFAAHLPDQQTGQVEPEKLRDILQEQIGGSVLDEAEEDFGKRSLTWAELLKPYEDFARRFPASRRIPYAQESADILRRMIAEDAAHHPKPLEQMTPAEQVTENIYQLRNLSFYYQIMDNHYPIDERTPDGKKEITPLHRLVDLGNAAVPQLIAALDDRTFTRSPEPDFHGRYPQIVRRVGDVAEIILEHLSGRSFCPQMRERTAEEKKADKLNETERILIERGMHRRTAGRVVVRSTRQLAEAWWAEVQGAGEKETLIKTASGGEQGSAAARKLVEKYPDAALAAIEAGMRAVKHDGSRAELIGVANRLPGEMPVAFLQAQLSPDHGLYSQVAAAEALFARGHQETVPAMIEAWRKIQSRLPTDEGDAYSEVGGIITFLAHCGDPRAVDALREGVRKNPVAVRLALVEVFWLERMSGGSIGEGVSVNRPDFEGWDRKPAAQSAANDGAIQRLLVAALDDTERRYGFEGTNREISLHDPRICDLAALALTQHWPQKYHFKWTADSAQCDPQIVALRNQWRVENGLPPVTPPPPLVIPAASEAEMVPLLDEFAGADDGRRQALTAQIAEKFGLGALPLVRARLEKSSNAIFRPLAINLASRVRDVNVLADASGSAEKSRVASLKGQALTGARLYQLANDLQDKLPADVRAVTFTAERTGDGTGFRVTVEWLPGKPIRYTGWKREMVVHGGSQNLLADIGGWAMEGVMSKESIYRPLGNALEKALQADIDAPIVVRLRIQRDNADAPE